MAPFARERSKKDATSELFDFVQERLPGTESCYEVAWHKLSSDIGAYPNSSRFVTSLWPGDLSLLLCEIDPATVHELRSWLATVSAEPRFPDGEVSEGDWRSRFGRGLVSSSDLVFLSFDPYMFDRHGKGKNPNVGHMFPDDLELIKNAISRLDRSILLQLSSYSANNDNPQAAVMDVWKRALAPELEVIADVRANGNMMSAVFARNICRQEELKSIPKRFTSWRSQIQKEMEFGA